MIPLTKTINRTFWDITGNPHFARVVGKPCHRPLWSRYTIQTGISNGRRVAVTEVMQARIIAELDNRIGSKLRKVAGETGLPKRLVTIAPRPLHIEIPSLTPPASIPWLASNPASLQRIPLGVAWDWHGEVPVWWDRTIETNAHIMVAGMSGSGKTMMMETILLSLMAHVHPNDLEIVGIDMKLRRLADLAHSAHFRHPIAYEHGAAMSLLMAVVSEMDRRIEQRISTPALALVIDEATDLLVGDKQAQEWFATIARRGRELGSFIIAGTQKPLLGELGQAPSQFGAILVGRMKTRKDAETISGTPLNADSLRHAGTFYAVGGLGEPVLFRGLLPTAADVRRTVYTGPATPSVLDIQPVSDAGSGREAVKVLRKQTQIEEDAETLQEAFGDQLLRPKAVTQNQMIEALGLDPKGGTFYDGRKRVRAALELLTTTTEESI